MCVLGAGVIGLTTAVTLAEAGHRVLVQTADAPEVTTSAAAGALWGPWQAEPRELISRWAADTLNVLSALADKPNAGVQLTSGIDVSNMEHEPPQWFSLLPDARPCRPDELPDGYSHGVRYTAPLVDMPTHLAYLADRLRASSGVIEYGALTSLDVPGSPVVVNCTGLGARGLAGDRELYPIRGQHVVTSNPGITEFLEVDTGDSPDLIAIYPHGDHLILGGTAEARSWNREPDIAQAQRILLRCAAVQPLVQQAQILGHRVGLRPTRPVVRLDEERTECGTRVIHNYGHGGAGVSLAWGCAKSVHDILVP